MKLHRHLLESIVDILQAVFEEGHYSDKAIEKAFKKNRKWGSTDRKLVAETVFDSVRWIRRLSTMAGIDQSRTYTRGDLWSIVGVYLWMRDIPLPEWNEWAHFDYEKMSRTQDKIKKFRKVWQSLPDWLDDLGEKHFGDRWDSIVQSLNEQSKVILRVNTLKATADQVIKDLKESDLDSEYVKGSVSALVLRKRANIFRTKSFKSGHIEVQDLSSQLVAPFSNAAPGEKVIDACAGAGGKTLHLAAMMKNKGKVIALDIHEHKLQELRKRARRGGVDIVEVRPIESTKTIKRLAEMADMVLLDVPCTGIGVLSRNPDTKWKLMPADVERLVETQREILESYSRMVKPNGRLVYSTCSILPEENSDQVKWFIEQHPEFCLEEEKLVLPDEGLGDGFYMARLKKGEIA